MEGKKHINIKLSVAIIFSIVFILIVCASIYFIFFYNKQSIDDNNNSSSNQEISQYYTPTSEELSRAKELADFLRKDLPKMDGSTSTIPLEGGILAKLFDLSQEKAEAGVVHSTTYGSFDNLMNNKCDIIFSTPLSKAQYNTAKSRNIELEVVPIVYEGFIFVVNASNPVDTLTQAQLRDIYSGKITNWKEVGRK